MSLLLRSCRSTIQTVVKNIKPVSVYTWQHATKPNNNNNKNNSLFTRFIQTRAGQVDDDEVDEDVLEDMFVDPEKPDLFDCYASDWSGAENDDDYAFKDSDNDDDD